MNLNAQRYYILNGVVMADLKQAIEWLLEGKNVRLRSWKDPKYYRFFQNGVFGASDDPDNWNHNLLIWPESDEWEIYNG